MASTPQYEDANTHKPPQTPPTIPTDHPSAKHESPCDPYLNFDGMTTGSMEYQPGAGSLRSSTSMAESIADTVGTDATSYLPTHLPSLQTKAIDEGNLELLRDDELDPRSFDLVAPLAEEKGVYSLEQRTDLLFSRAHMGAIVKNPLLLGEFIQFLSTVRPTSLPLLTYYLETEKALRAIKYANAIATSLKPLDGYGFTTATAEDTANSSLQDRRDAAFEALTRDELPVFITHKWIEVVSLSIKLRIIGTMPPHLREASEGLAEVFCLTDPSRRDNPIILASDEFHRTTQYGTSYAIGRNCRFLQGPATNPFSVKRIRDRIAAGREHYETFLNYRRDGSPFLNLLLIAPLIDHKGQVRYFLGAQVDVSGLAKECAGLDGLREIIEDEEDTHQGPKTTAECCRELSEMFDRTELDTIRRYGGNIHKTTEDTSGSLRPSDSVDAQGYVVIEDGTSPQQSPMPEGMQRMEPALDPSPSGRLAGVYENYLLVRPSPSLQVLFASPSLRVPGMLQSPFLNRIGGSGRVRSRIAEALAEGQGVTAKIRWLSSTRKTENNRGRPRWLHCTPLRGVNHTIGIWMVVIVDEEQLLPSGPPTPKATYSQPVRQSQRPKLAPAIDPQPKSQRASVINTSRRAAPSETRQTVQLPTSGVWAG